MQSDVTTQEYQLDRVDLALLTLLADDPLWKSEAHAQLLTLDRVDTVSVQTVGRRIDRLHQEDYLATKIVTPEDLDRDLMIAFQTTAEGRTMFEGGNVELCNTDGCGQLRQVGDHRHEWVSPKEYFCRNE